MWKRTRKRRPESARPARNGAAAREGEAPSLDGEAARDQGEVGAAAIALLARRDYSSGELTAKLRERGFAASAVHAVISDLLDQRFLDDARYAARRTALQVNRGQGPLRIRRELADLEIDPPLIEIALAEWDWPSQARAVRGRKFGPEPPAEWREKARQARFLQYRGFSADHIRSALGADLDPDS